MRRLLYTILILALAATALAQPDARPQLASLTADARERLLRFLLTDCSVGTPWTRATLLAGVSEAALWEAYRTGPEQAQLAKARTALEKAYQQRQDFLRRSDSQALPKDELARAAQESRTTYVDRKLAEVSGRYRANALTGLGVVGTDASVPELRQIAADEKNPASGAAKAALEAIAARR
jgi:hypothetical protein